MHAPSGLCSRQSALQATGYGRSRAVVLPATGFRLRALEGWSSYGWLGVFIGRSEVRPNKPLQAAADARCGYVGMIRDEVSAARG